MRILTWTMGAMVGAWMLGGVGCGIAGPGDFGEDEDSVGSGAGSTGRPPVGSGGDPGSGAGGTTGAGNAGSGAMHPTTTGAGAGGTTGSGGSTGSGGGSTGSGGSGGNGPNGCYTEGWDPNASLADLESSYSSSQWLPTMVELLNRRYHNGGWLLTQQQNDPWLSSSFPGYFDLSNWYGFIESIDTACHEETHGYDYDQALSLNNQHLYYMGSNREVIAPKLGFFARNAILSLVQAGGSVTSNYDSTYLTGTQGSYDFIALADELTAYINGLACAVSVGDEIQAGPYGHSYRDGAASHLLYLLHYLKVARTQYPNLYSQWQASSDWQTFVRFSWARGHFWTDESSPYSKLGINDAAIWQRITDPANEVEIQHFTGDPPAVVACNP
ncbi:MAG: hypothetical protein KC731_04195 [Myxococcales bacterium]|nr:hypothetical protein [Myxococcales bacterium]